MVNLGNVLPILTFLCLAHGMNQLFFFNFPNKHFFYRPVSEQGPSERALLEHLFDTYEVLERPVVDDDSALEVKFGLTLQQIIDVVCSHSIFSKKKEIEIIQKAKYFFSLMKPHF